MIDVKSWLDGWGVNKEDQQDLIILATSLAKQGLNDDEIRSYLRCTQEVNPTLPETIALKRMAAIREGVAARRSIKN